MTISRRDLLQATAVAGAAALSLPLVKVPLPSFRKPLFFTPAEFAVVDEMSDMIIPTDQQSGGARAAGESFEPEQPTTFRAGLKAIEDLSREMNGKAFMESTPEQRLALLTRIAANESDPKTPAEQFFKQIKGATVRAYYTSKIGIHDDQRYKGNVYQTGEYAGYDPT